jgi:hypothetical protein
MIVNNKRNSVKDFQIQGNQLVRPENSSSDASPKKKRTRRLPGRSKSLADATGYKSKPPDANRNHAYLRRAPTQDDIYKILNETEGCIRPSTGELKSLSPYVPLPAIGSKFRPLKDSDSEVPSCDDGAQKLVRAGTYNVLEPKFVKGPIVSNASRNAADTFRENIDNKQSKPAVNQLQESSATIVFGPRLEKEEENVIQEESTVADLPGQQRHGQISTSHLDTNIQIETNVSANQTNSITVQKLYYRDVEANEIPRQADAVTSSSNTGHSAHERTSDKPDVQHALWFHW